MSDCPLKTTRDDDINDNFIRLLLVVYSFCGWRRNVEADTIGSVKNTFILSWLVTASCAHDNIGSRLSESHWKCSLFGSRSFLTTLSSMPPPSTASRGDESASFRVSHWATWKWPLRRAVHKGDLPYLVCLRMSSCAPPPWCNSNSQISKYPYQYCIGRNYFCSNVVSSHAFWNFVSYHTWEPVHVYPWVERNSLYCTRYVNSARESHQADTQYKMSTDCIAQYNRTY